MSPVGYRLTPRRMGELLVERGAITHDQLDEALRARNGKRERLGQVLVRLGMVGEAEITKLLAEQFSLPVAGDDDLARADPEAVKLIPEHLAREACLIAIRLGADALDVVVSDPLDVVSLDHLRTLSRCAIRTMVGRPTQILEAIDEFYQEIRSSEKVGEILDKLDYTGGDSEEPEDVDIAALRQQVEDAPVVRLVNLMLAEAIEDRASDIHLEATRERVMVRYRIDGVLHEVMRPPKNLQMAIVSRIKVLADLDIAQRLVPQDGRFTIHLPDREVDLRVSTLPTAYGEKVVMRLFDKGAFRREIEQLGMDEASLAIFQRAIRQPYGMILISGPTGSGKTTTLYAALNEIRSVVRNLVTVEDPIEYHIDAVNQVHANAKVGMTFARALRAILRQDPDVIMVGEIRDPETADIAVKCALTGHLVFSTVHANDAPGTVTRLVDMGVPRYLVGSAVSLLIAQRLVRRICERCKEPYRAERDHVAALGPDGEALLGQQLWRGRGCMACKQTGYYGRMAIFEMLEMNRALRRSVLDGMNDDQIRVTGMGNGMITLRASGLRALREGTTTVDEVRAATLTYDA
jgi:type IV pilus assembly protein PilB